MGRGYKFKAWHPQWKCFIEMSNLSLEYHSHWVLMSDFTGTVGYHWFQKDQVRIVEWTGLTDKTGRDIYEEDIVFCADDMDFYPVVFHSGMFCIYNRNDDTYSPLYEYLHDSVVYGNTFENPEYLTEPPEKTIERLAKNEQA